MPRPKSVDETTSSPWTIRGVNNETRNAAKKAAKKEKLTLGEWVDRTLLDAAQNTLGTGGKPKDVGPTIEEMMSDFIKNYAASQKDQESRMDAIQTEIDKINEYRSKTWFQRLRS